MCIYVNVCVHEYICHQRLANVFAYFDEHRMDTGMDSGGFDNGIQEQTHTAIDVLVMSDDAMDTRTEACEDDAQPAGSTLGRQLTHTLQRVVANVVAASATRESRSRSG
jgi:hypothetical protein